MTPLAGVVSPGGVVHLAAQTTNTSAAPAWTIQESGHGSLVIAPDGNSADYIAPSTLGSYHVVAAIGSLSLQATAEIKVVSAEDAAFLTLQTTPYKMNMQPLQVARGRSRSRGRKEYLPPPPGEGAFDLVDANVVWSLAEGALAGTVNPTTGDYTAPSRPGVYHLIATSVDNPRVQGSIEIRVLDTIANPTQPLVAGTISTRPNLVYLEPLDQAYLKAQVGGVPSTAVSWSLVEGASAGQLSAPTGGADNEVQFTAPGAGGNFHILATSLSNPALQAQVNAQVDSRVSLKITPALSQVSPGAMLDFTATVTGSALTDVVWNSPDPVGGILSPSGNTARFRAPATPGTYYISARPKADLEKQVLASIQVTGSSNVSVKILPSPQKVQFASQVQWVAQVLGTSNTNVVWSASAGTITSTGLLSTPGTTGPVTVTATSVADASKQDTVTIQVGNLPQFTSVPPLVANPAATLTYVPSASHPDSLPVTLALVASPTGATFSGGLVSWLPASSQYLLENQFILSATDNQGGVTFQRWTVNFRVSGQWRTIYHALDGTLSTIPADLSGNTIAALVPNGSSGFQTYAGTGTATGTFWIPGVPPGFYWFQNGQSYDWLDTSRVDFRLDRVGRAAGFQLPILATIATFNIGGMNPWNVPLVGTHAVVENELAWYDPNNPTNSGFDYLDSYLAPPLQAPGALAMTGSLNLQSVFFPPNLSSTALGDRPMIIHYDVVPAPGGDWQSIVREVFEPTSLNMVDGSPFTLSGTFSRAYPQIVLDLSMDIAPIAALKTIAAPAAATLYRYTFLVDAELPSGRTDQLYLQNAATPPLHQYLWTQSVPATGIMATGPVTTLNFFPNGYVLKGVFSAAWRMSYLLPGTTTPFRFSGFVNASIPGTTGTIQLTNLPATLRINGATATSDLSGVGFTPVLRVVADPFTAGNSPARFITVRRLGVNGALTVSESSFFLFHFPINEDFRLPPGILEAGKTYMFSVAMGSSAQDGATTISGFIRP